MPKRRHSCDWLLREDEADMHIIVHGRSQPFKAHYQVLSLYSRCAKDLPRPTNGSPVIWDVSRLLPEGASEPFDATTVEDYLNVVYARVDPLRRAKPLSGLKEARPLLLFADAAASSPLVFDDLSRMLLSNNDLKLPVYVSEQLQVQLPLRGHIYLSLRSGGLADAPIPSSYNQRTWLLHSTQLPPAQVQAFASAVCGALEEWLYLAGRLRMVELTRLLLDFVTAQVTPGPDLSICLPGLGSIYSPRVLQCMPQELLLEGFLRSRIMDVPTAMLLDTAEVSTIPNTTTAATLMNQQLGASARFVVTSGQPRSILLDTVGMFSWPLNLTIGGLDAASCDKVVKEVLEKAMSDE